MRSAAALSMVTVFPPDDSATALIVGRSS